MPSPFPGMDPYLERPDEWESFHHSLATRIADALAAVVPPNYRVLSERRLVVDRIDEDGEPLRGRSVRPDDVVLAEGGGGTAVLEAPPIVSPAQIELEEPEYEPEEQAFIAIRDRSGRRVITAIEILSPANKDEHRAAYLRKRWEYRHDGISVVELDLLRGGRRVLPGLPPCDYYAAVSVGGRNKFHLWPFALRDPMPQVPIPLRHPDPPVTLDLKAAVEAAYDAGRYARFLYDAPVVPALPPADAAWAGELAERAKADAA